MHIQEEELRRQLKTGVELGLEGWLSMLKWMCSNRVWNEAHHQWEYIQPVSQ